MGIKQTEGEVRAVIEGMREYVSRLMDSTVMRHLTAYANLLAEHANAEIVGWGRVSSSGRVVSFCDIKLPDSLNYTSHPLYLHPPKNTNPLNHPTQDLYEHFLAVHNLYHTEDLRKAFYHGAGEHTPEELVGFGDKEF